MVCSHNTFGLHYGIRVIDCAPPQAYNGSVIIVPCERVGVMPLHTTHLTVWRHTKEACYDEDRARLPCNIRPLSRLAALSLPQGDDD